MSIEVDTEQSDLLDRVGPVGIEPNAIVENTGSQPVIDTAMNTIHELNQPRPSNKRTLDDITSSPPADDAERVAKIARRTFPYPTREGLMAVVAQQEIQTQKAREKEKLSDEYIHKIDELLKLTAQLTALPEGDKVTFNDEIKKTLTDLKAQGVDLWKDDKTIDIAFHRVTELKALISHQTEKHTTMKQQVVMKMTKLANDLLALLEMAKGMHAAGKKEIDTMIRHQRTGG